jgi:hypothetical protein
MIQENLANEPLIIQERVVDLVTVVDFEVNDPFVLE